MWYGVRDAATSFHLSPIPNMQPSAGTALLYDAPSFQLFGRPGHQYERGASRLSGSVSSRTVVEPRHNGCRASRKKKKMEARRDRSRLLPMKATWKTGGGRRGLVCFGSQSRRRESAIDGSSSGSGNERRQNLPVTDRETAQVRRTQNRASGQETDINE